MKLLTHWSSLKVGDSLLCNGTARWVSITKVIKACNFTIGFEINNTIEFSVSCLKDYFVANDDGIKFVCLPRDIMLLLECEDKENI